MDLPYKIKLITVFAVNWMSWDWGLGLRFEFQNNIKSNRIISQKTPFNSKDPTEGTGLQTEIYASCNLCCIETGV